MIDGCEWNPSENRPVRSDEKSHARAEVVLGNGIWRLCANCAKLPAFAKMHYKTTEIKRSEL